MRAAPLHGAVGEQRIVAGDDEIAGRGDHHAAHDAVALDLGDGGLGQVAPAHGVLEEALEDAPILALEAGLERRLLLVLHLLRAAEVVAGREMLAGAGQDDDAHLVVVDCRREGVVELLEQDAALRVQDFRPVGRDLEHGALGALGEQGGVGHVGSPLPMRSTKLSQ